MGTAGMDAPRHKLSAGQLVTNYQAELEYLQKEKLLNRIWAQDLSLWPAEEGGERRLRANLEFLQLPERIFRLTESTLRMEGEAQSEGLTQRLFIAFESVLPFCETVLHLREDKESLKCVALESCLPSTIRHAEKQVDFAKTLLLFVNKSGYRLEDHALFLYFQKKLQVELGGEYARHFAASSERKTYLTAVAQEYGFRFVQELPARILPTYTAVLDLAVLLLVFAKLDPEVVRICCREMKKEYSEGEEGRRNPVVEAAAFLTATARSGRKMLAILAPRALAPYGDSLCKLIGGSLGQGEAGLYPLQLTSPCATEALEKNASAVVLRQGGQDDAHTEAVLGELEGRGIPFLSVPVADPLDLLRQTYLWQIATALAASRLDIDPFNGGEARLPRSLANEMLNHLSPHKNTLERRPWIREGNLQLFAEARARQEISQLNLVECLASFWARRDGAKYVGFYVFLEPKEETKRSFEALRDQISQRLDRPVLLTWGPRSLDRYGYFMREDSPRGLHLVVTGEPAQDIKIPGAGYSFGQLYRAIALGQFEALSNQGGLALRLHAASAEVDGPAELTHAFQQALRRVRS